jgi:hypothetical protein
MTEDQHLRRRRSRRHVSPFVRLLQTYWVELAIVLGLLLTVFLFFEQMNIRATVFAWLSRIDDAAMALINRGIDASIWFRAGFGLSETIAIPLLLVVLIATAWRVRWRLQRTPSLVTLTCPRCGGRIHRTHRHASDRLISLVVPVRRYRCMSKDCRWHGLRVEGISRQPQPAPVTEEQPTQHVAP